MQAQVKETRKKEKKKVEKKEMESGSSKSAPKEEGWNGGGQNEPNNNSKKRNLENRILRRSSCGYNGKSINTYTHIVTHLQLDVNGYMELKLDSGLWAIMVHSQQSMLAQSNTILTIMRAKSEQNKIDMANRTGY